MNNLFVFSSEFGKLEFNQRLWPKVTELNINLCTLINGFTTGNNQEYEYKKYHDSGQSIHSNNSSVLGQKLFQKVYVVHVTKTIVSVC